MYSRIIKTTLTNNSIQRVQDTIIDPKFESILKSKLFDILFKKKKEKKKRKEKKLTIIY